LKKNKTEKNILMVFARESQARHYYSCHILKTKKEDMDKYLKLLKRL